MKKILFTLLILTFALSFAQISFAGENTQENKFKRGLINIVTSPLEIPNQIGKSQKDAGEKKSQQLGAFVTGLVKGVAYTGGRIGSGAWDIVTFNLAIPENYEPLMKPNYIYRNKDSE